MRKLFLFEQHYTVELDEHMLDTYGCPQEDRALFHRLFQAIVSYPRALNAFCTYRVLQEHDLATGGSHEYVKKTYGKEMYDIDALLLLRSCFSLEDAAYLEQERERHLPDLLFSLDDWLEPLFAACSVEAAVFTVTPE